MAWKTERWLEDVFPGKECIYDAYRHLSGRELAIVAAAVLDAALADILARRFRDMPPEIESFLGANGDGRAPAASFGARIQLALLLGIILAPDAAVLRQVKAIRNLFAHRVQIDICAPESTAAFRALLDRWLGVLNGFQPDDIALNAERVRPIREKLGVVPDAAEGLLLAILTVYQAYFHRLSENVRRVDVIGPK
jgi:hypothetical protein